MSYKCTFDGLAGEELSRIAQTQGRTEACVVESAISLYKFVIEELSKAPDLQLAIVDSEEEIPERIIKVPGL